MEIPGSGETLLRAKGHFLQKSSSAIAPQRSKFQMQQASRAALTIISGLMRQDQVVAFYREGRFGRAAEPKRSVECLTFSLNRAARSSLQKAVGQMTAGDAF